MAEIEIDLAPPPVKLRRGAPASSGDEVLVVMAVGPQGPEGPAGPPGGDPYTHTQSSAAATWVIEHNLGRFPQVTVVDDDNQAVLADVIYASVNAVSVVFASPQTGAAYLI